MTALTGDFADYGRNYHEQVGMAEALRRAFSNFANFQGRANRGEYWWFVLSSVLINIAMQALDWTFFVSADGGLPFLSLAWALLSFLPGLSLTIRRLHDLDRSGWSMFIALIPLVGIILFIIRMSKQGQASPNRFG